MNCLLGVCLGTVMWRPVSIFFGGEIRANPAYWRSPTESSQHISTILFSKTIFPQSTQRTRTTWTYLNLNDLTTKICLEEKLVCNLLCCYAFVIQCHPQWGHMWIDSLIILSFSRALRFQYLLAGSCSRNHIEIAGKLSSLGSPQASSKPVLSVSTSLALAAMRELVHVQGGQMPDVCKIDVLFLFLVHDFLSYALVYLLSLTYLKYPQTSCGHVVAWGCIYTFLSLARPVRKPDWCQVLGSHRRWARHWPNRYLVQQ